MLRPVQKSKQLIVFALRNRVVFMIVALRAPGSKSHPSRTDRISAVDGLLEAILEARDTGLAVIESHAIKASRHALLDAGIRQ